MEKKISKNQKMYPHRFGCSQNHPKAPKKPIVADGNEILSSLSVKIRIGYILVSTEYRL